MTGTSGNMTLKVAVLYICTGRYTQFFDGFYKSAKAHFLRGKAQTDYYVFTDDNGLCQAPDVHLIQRDCQGFPKDTLERFEMFMGISHELEKYDYICFFNSNAVLKKDVGLEILPKENCLIVVRWIGQKPCDCSMFYPYERNKRSTAYVKPYDGPYAYYMGGFYGGWKKAFLSMVKELQAATKEDAQKGITARNNDESHLNCYMHKHPHDELPQGYCCAEERLSDKFETKVVFRNKVAMSSYFDKGRRHSLVGRCLHGSKTLWLALKWYIT